MESNQSREAGRALGVDRPWLYHVFMVPALVGCLIVEGVSIFYYFKGSCSFFACIDQVPYRHAIIWLVFFAILVKWTDRWRKQRSRTASQ